MVCDFLGLDCRRVCSWVAQMMMETRQACAMALHHAGVAPIVPVTSRGLGVLPDDTQAGRDFMDKVLGYTATAIIVLGVGTGS